MWETLAMLSMLSRNVLLLNLIHFALSLKSTGRNVCEVEEKYYTTVRTQVPYSYNKYTTKWCFKIPPRCTVWVPVWDYKYVDKDVVKYRLVPKCCRGFAAAPGEEDCSPQCRNPCKHGICTAPNTCTCEAGFQGSNCEETCKQGHWGERCVNECLCYNGAFCHGVSGKCYCSPGWRGERCDLPCEEGSYGLNCQNSCSCDEFQCHHITGDCIFPSTTTPYSTTREEITTPLSTSTEEITTPLSTSTEEITTPLTTSTEEITTSATSTEEITTPLTISTKEISTISVTSTEVVTTISPTFTENTTISLSTATDEIALLFFTSTEEIKTISPSTEGITIPFSTSTEDITITEYNRERSAAKSSQQDLSLIKITHLNTATESTTELITINMAEVDTSAAEMVEPTFTSVSTDTQDFINRIPEKVSGVPSVNFQASSESPTVLIETSTQLSEEPKSVGEVMSSSGKHELAELVSTIVLSVFGAMILLVAAAGFGLAKRRQRMLTQAQIQKTDTGLFKFYGEATTPVKILFNNPTYGCQPEPLKTKVELQTFKATNEDSFEQKLRETLEAHYDHPPSFVSEFTVSMEHLYTEISSQYAEGRTAFS